MMRIYIPSRSRAEMLATNIYSTLRYIPAQWIPKTCVVVYESQARDYQQALKSYTDQGLEVFVMEDTILPIKCGRIGAYAKKRGEDAFLLADDDMQFYIRNSWDDWHLRYQNHEDMLMMLEDISEYLREYTAVGISGREGNNRITVDINKDLTIENTRLSRCIAYQTKPFCQVEHGRVPTRGDFDVLLQLLRQGHKSISLYYYAQGHRKSQDQGGCADYRTIELQNESAEKLARLHPGFVTLRQKTNKTDADGYGSRTEVTIQWKKAYESAKEITTSSSTKKTIPTPTGLFGNVT